jgi:threonine/homoserine/homoserine lactone efflux protein
LFNIPNLPIFMAAALILLLIPGPAVLYIVARSLDQGRWAGFVSVLGIEAGNFVLAAATALGLSAILVSSTVAFSIIKYLGAAYLAYLGIRRLLMREMSTQAATLQKMRPGHIFRQGILVAILNPKTALFFLAFLPQFVDSSKGSIALQLLALGSLFVLMAICTDGLYSLMAGTASQWLKDSRLFPWIGRYVIGSVYIGLGIAAALAGTI